MHVLSSRLESILFPFNCGFNVSLPTQRSPVIPPVPDLPIELWLEIFQFATYVHRSATIKPLDPFTLRRTSNNAMAANTPTLSMRTKLSLVLVSRSWRRAAVQMLYEHLVIRSPLRARAILKVLEDSCKLSESSVPASHPYPLVGHGQWTRHIEVYTHARGANDVRYLHTLFRIFQHCPSLRILSGAWSHPLPLEFMNGISRLYGRRLEGLYWNEQAPESPQNHSTLATPEFMASFQELRVLDLRHFVGSDLSERSKTNLPIPALPRLQDLILSTNPRSLSAATALLLPSLRNLTLKTSVNDPVSESLLVALLKAHGKSLITVDLPSPSPDSEPEPDSSHSRRTAVHVNPDIFLRPDLCPNLTSLTFPVTSPPLAPHVHNSLRRIGLRGIRAESLYPDKSTSGKAHLLAITPTRYPNLELVRTVGFLVDAETDGLIKDIFIWWVEKFEKFGIDFLDGEGVLWAYTEPEVATEEGTESSATGAGAMEKLLLEQRNGKEDCPMDRGELKDAIFSKPT